MEERKKERERKDKRIEESDELEDGKLTNLTRETWLFLFLPHKPPLPIFLPSLIIPYIAMATVIERESDGTSKYA